jgi:hypothetical protein
MVMVMITPNQTGAEPAVLTAAMGSRAGRSAVNPGATVFGPDLEFMGN